MKIDVTNNVGEFINNTPSSPCNPHGLQRKRDHPHGHPALHLLLGFGLFSNYSALNNFLTATGLGTDHGKATIDAKANANCGATPIPMHHPLIRVS